MQLFEWCEAIKGEGNLAEFDCCKMAKGVNVVSFKAMFLHH